MNNENHNGNDELCSNCPTPVKIIGLFAFFGLGIATGVATSWGYRALSLGHGLQQEHFFQPKQELGATTDDATLQADIFATPAGLQASTSSSRPVEPDVLQQHVGLYADKSSFPEFKNTLLLTSANYGYLDMLENWECHAKKLGLDWVVIAMDERLFKYAGSGRAIMLEGQQVAEEARFGKPNFATLACNKLRTVLKVMQKTNFDIVFTDCDNVFRRDPFRAEFSLGSMMRQGSYDYIYSRKSKPPGPKVEDFHKEPDRGNTGFYYIASSKKPVGSQHIFDAGVQRCNTRKGVDDQENFWDTLVQFRKGKLSDASAFQCFRHCGEKSVCQSIDDPNVFNYCDMSPWEYAEGSLAHASKETRLVAYHANWVFGKRGKIEKLKSVALWNPNC